MLGEYRAADVCAFCVMDVDVVATVVFSGVASTVSACGVWCPGLANFRDNMSFDFASKWCKGVAGVVMLPVDISVTETGFSICAGCSMFSVCSA